MPSNSHIYIHITSPQPLLKRSRLFCHCHTNFSHPFLWCPPTCLQWCSAHPHVCIIGTLLHHIFELFPLLLQSTHSRHPKLSTLHIFHSSSPGKPIHSLSTHSSHPPKNYQTFLHSLLCTNSHVTLCHTFILVTTHNPSMSHHSPFLSPFSPMRSHMYYFSLTTVTKH